MRRGSYTTGFVIGLLLGLAMFLVAVPLFGGVFDNAQKDLKTLRSCDAGLISTLAGKGGKGYCYNNSDEQEFVSKYNIPASMQVQYIGAGWGCPDKPKPSYCWLVYPKDKNQLSIGDIAKARCENKGAGTLTIVRQVDGSDDCYEQGTKNADPYPSEDIKFRYFPQTGETECEYTVKVTGSSGSKEKAMPKGPCTQSFGTVYAIYGDDKAAFNEGGTIDVTLKVGSTVKNEQFKIAKPENPMCPTEADTGCIGKTIGVQENGFCLLRNDRCVFQTEYKCVDIVEGTPRPADKPLKSGETVCKRVIFKSNNYKECKLDIDIDNTWNEALFICTPLGDGKCMQSYGASDSFMPSGDDEYDRLDEKGLYPVCLT